MSAYKLTGDDLLDGKIGEWLTFDKNEETKATIIDLANSGEHKKLRDILLKRLTFGTAGIRGCMGAGSYCINDLVIIQTSQGLAEYLLKHDHNCTSTGGVIIGYDGRHNSARFAQRTAVAFIQRRIPVYLFSKVVPTPFVPFGVKLFNLTAGIMITASHNPKDDNGYKVYFSNGAQIKSPHDVYIQEMIEKNLEPWSEAWNLSLSGYGVDCTDPFTQVEAKYYEDIRARIYDVDLLNQCTIQFTHTSLHGVGHNYVKKAFETIGLKHLFHPVIEQKDVNPDFPTVHFPNPEEGKGVLDLSIKTANSVKSTVIIANDPDVDRCALAERQIDSSFRIFTGNEIGALLGWWLWFKYSTLNPQCVPSDCYMIASAVSSKILAAIGEKEGFNFIETLTGFKWMGNKADELIKAGKTVLFAFEEAIGYMCGANVLDKDGITAAIELVQLAAEYGYHFNVNSYYICYDEAIIANIFKRLQNYHETNKYPQSIGEHKITRVRDLQIGYDNATADNIPELPLSSNYMVTFYLDNGVVITIRTSGTEPKIKYYSEIITQPGQIDRLSSETTLNTTIQLMVEEFLEPQKNDLIPKTD